MQVRRKWNDKSCRKKGLKNIKPEFYMQQKYLSKMKESGRETQEGGDMGIYIHI